MADVNDKTISRSDTGFPAYLDYDKLRSSAIEYLGRLSGKIWTDYNEHDPGITILETLIYALTDLGYRTNLPATDLFTRDPADTTKDNNFFPTARILGNNPLTITDYRKMLVDLHGVRNAWLEVDDAIPVTYCDPSTPDPAFRPEASDDEPDFCRCSTLNGLYHVFIQLEDGIDKNKHQYDKTLRSVRDALMTHRNLCEDFIDVKILCKLELGLCVEVDLEADADAEEVYVTMVEALQKFFSPSPDFYSLEEMLDKGKSIDDLFAGRPYNVTESRGFVDTGELEKITLRKELHLSDVYQIISGIAGVRRLRNLGWIKCCDDKVSSQEWKLRLPENHLPSFSTSCSGFTFTRNGLPEKVDLAKFENYFTLKRSGLSPAWYKEPAAFLDPVFPQGVYRSDLADYYSLAHEFPRVYGIGEGGLSADEPDKRKAQALQLQGFLLFFDQLLANYLTQLKNVRSLFALSSGPVSAQRSTYFINPLSNAPQLEKLLRFHVEADGNNALGTTGSIQAYPVDRIKFEALLASGELEKNCDPDLPPYSFCFAADRDMTRYQLTDDFLFGTADPSIIRNSGKGYFFYFLLSSPEVVLVSKNFYPGPKQAAEAAASVKYAATFAENYRSFETRQGGNEKFSFDIELNLDVYTKYLQLIVEDQSLYQQRRQGFLDHLLARFAETFADYALLTAPYVPADQLPGLEIKKEERFLSSYDDISSNRGKGYDYLKDNWNSSNISGFEKRVKALAGIDDWSRHYLCHFVVEPADKLYKLSVLLFDMAFAVPDKTFSAIEGLASLKSVFAKWLSPVFEYDFISHQQRYQVFVRDDFGNRFAHNKWFAGEDEAKTFSETLDAAFRFTPDLTNDVFISQYINKVLFVNAAGATVKEAVNHFPDEARAVDFLNEKATDINAALRDKKQFTPAGAQGQPEELLPVTTGALPYVFIDAGQFVCRVLDVYHLNEERKRYSLLNRKAGFQFDSIGDFSDTASAKLSFREMLPLMSLPGSYSTVQNRETEKFEIFVSGKEGKALRYFDDFGSSALAAEKIKEILVETGSFTYRFSITAPIPDQWEFRYRSADGRGNRLDYVSQGVYRSAAQASAAATDFYAALPHLQASAKGSTVTLLDKKGKTTVTLAEEQRTADNAAKAAAVLASAQQLFRAVSAASDKTLMSILEKNRVNPGEDFIYKLVDKDNLRAQHAVLPDPVTGIADVEKDRSALLLRGITGYNYVDIARGTNIIRERKDEKTRITWYHYQLVCSNRKYQTGSEIGKDLVLFESTRGFGSAEEALTAFSSEYLQVMKYARNPGRYGPGLPISLTEILVHSTDVCDQRTAMVFVPAETTLEFGGYEVQKTIAPMAASYPVRLKRKNKYVFVLGPLDETAKTWTADWKSYGEFPTAGEAMQQFQYFLVLLKYPGNFYAEKSSTQCDDTLYIREVLLLSAHGFATAKEAWGVEGVEKLICVSQSDHGFHHYLGRTNCQPGFYVACNDTGLRHPCTYDTPARRDKVMDQLFQAADFSFMDLVQEVTENHIILTGLDKKPLVTIHTGENKDLRYSPCEWLVRFYESVYSERNYVRKKGGFSLNYRYTPENSLQEKYYVLAEPADPNATFKSWKQALQQIAGYFPVRRSADACSNDNGEKFTVEIRLPSVDPKGRDLPGSDPCSSPCREPDCTPGCYLSWISDCCFSSCCEALDFYLSALLLLKDFSNYKAEYDCPCGPYGIGLHPQLTLQDKRGYMSRSAAAARDNNLCQQPAKNGNAFSGYVPAASRPGLHCLSEIVAFNPQFYSSTNMACEAVSRSGTLINAEGLHLVEHILFRPRCHDDQQDSGDCNCDGLPAPRPAGRMDCHFPWNPGEDSDPCETNHKICFTPGCDPYSFIATLVLPAWPKRFRSESGRKIVEKMMQREAPAHVLLRILWLRPADFCCVEHFDKLWIEWLAHKTCDPAYSNCDFIDLLFRKYNSGLPACTDCAPCSCDPVNSCAPVYQDPCSLKTVVGEIDALYGWSADAKTAFDYCQPGPPPQNPDAVDTPVLLKEEKAVATTSVEKKMPATVSATASASTPAAMPVAAAAEPAATAGPGTADLLLREKSRLVQSRARRYELQVDALLKNYPEKAVVINSMIFLKKPQPTSRQYEQLAESIVKDKTVNAKNIQGLKKGEKQALIEGITWKFLDSVCFNSNDLESILVLKNTFSQLREKGIDFKAVYKGWESEKLQEVEPLADLKKIRKYLEG